MRDGVEWKVCLCVYMWMRQDGGEGEGVRRWRRGEEAELEVDMWNVEGVNRGMKRWVRRGLEGRGEVEGGAGVGGWSDMG